MSAEQHVMTWRARIAAARVRGAFTDADIDCAEHPGVCAVGEVAERTGLGYYVVDFEIEWNYANGVAMHPADGLFPCLVRQNRIDEAERLLFAIEDRALQLKREAGSAHAPASPRRAARP